MRRECISFCLTPWPLAGSITLSITTTYGVRKFTGNFDVQCEARGISWVKCQPSSGRDRFNNVALCNYDLTVETESAILVFIHLSSLPNWRCPAKSAT
jgi:hypothetical protein